MDKGVTVTVVQNLNQTAFQDQFGNHRRAELLSTPTQIAPSGSGLRQPKLDDMEFFRSVLEFCVKRKKLEDSGVDRRAGQTCGRVTAAD
jgi:hypothetical protein